MTGPDAHPDASAGIEAVAALVTTAGVSARRLRQAIAALTDGPWQLDDLVRATALPRRTIGSLLRAADPDLRTDHAGAVGLQPKVRDAYRERFGYEQLRRTEPGDPYVRLSSEYEGLTGQIAQLIGRAPGANRSLDHVVATPETVIRRAVWLAATFDLQGAHLLCVGDHDLTSLAVAALIPHCRTSVVDVDERLLEYIAVEAGGLGAAITCWYADLRFGMPPGLVDSADLIFTDPPYTPDGVQLFLGRGAQSLRDRVNGRLVMAYGFSPLAPALGVKVQRAVHDLDLAVEAILPAFNRYHGAQAVGSASDLYVCRPTSRTWQILDRRVASATVNLYTRGVQAAEGQSNALSTEVATATYAKVGDPHTLDLVGDGWPHDLGAARRLPLADLFAGPVGSNQNRPAAANLSADPGAWLLRTLLCLNAERIALLVPNNHPDLATADAQAALRDIVSTKFDLRLRRSTPTSQHAIVEATEVDLGGGLTRWLLTHAHGKVGNVLREGLIRSRDKARDGADTATLTKSDARALAVQLVAEPAWLDVRLVDLPRFAVSALVSATANHP